MVLLTLTCTFYYTSDQILCTNTEKSIGKERKKGQYTFPSKNGNLPTASSCHQYIFRSPYSLFLRVISRAVSLMAFIQFAARLQFGLPGQKCRIIYKECVVPENIQTPTVEGISLRSPHLTGFSIFARN